MKEQDRQSGKEKWGRRVLYGGIIAGVIGLIISPELVLAGAGLAGAGIIFESRGKKKLMQFQAAA